MMTEDTFIHIIETSFISIILCIIFFGSYAIFHARTLLILGFITLGVYGIVWGGACIADMFSSAKDPNSNTSVIGVIAYIALALLISFLFFKFMK